jgi:hypothetical protein
MISGMRTKSDKPLAPDCENSMIYPTDSFNANYGEQAFPARLAERNRFCSFTPIPPRLRVHFAPRYVGLRSPEATDHL